MINHCWDDIIISPARWAIEFERWLLIKSLTAKEKKYKNTLGHNDYVMNMFGEKFRWQTFEEANKSVTLLDAGCRRPDKLC